MEIWIEVAEISGASTVFTKYTQHTVCQVEME